MIIYIIIMNHIDTWPFSLLAAGMKIISSVELKDI